MGTHKTIGVMLTKKMLKIIDELIKEGDYRNRQDFLTEAIRAHLNTWYPKKWNPNET